MRRVLALVGCGLLLAAACTSSGSSRAATEAAVRHYVQAWVAGGPALARTVTGADAGRLAAALRTLSDGGVVRTACRIPTEC